MSRVGNVTVAGKVGTGSDTVNGATANTVAVRSVGYTPIKGMRHIVRMRPESDEFGPVGDRRFCSIDVDCRRRCRIRGCSVSSPD